MMLRSQTPWLCIAMLAGLALSSMAHAGNAPASDAGIVTVRVSQLPTKRETIPGRVAEYKVMERFLELHPDIRLESTTPLRVEGMDADTAVLMQIAGGNAPDLIFVNFRLSDTYISQGFLYPLDEYVNKLPPGEIKERIPATVLPAIYRPGPDGKEHYWAFPQEVFAMVMLYRKDLFALAGLDPAQPPKDWDELLRDAKQLTDPATGTFGLAFNSGPQGAWTVFPYITSTGTRIVTRQADGNWKATFDTPEAVTSYTFIDQLMKTSVTKNGLTGPITYRGTDVDNMYDRGKIGIYYGYLGAAARFNPDLVAAAPVPKSPAGLSSAEVNVNMLGIFSGVKDKKVRDAAWEYIRFSGSREGQRIFTKSMVEMGASHLVNPFWLKEFGYPELAKRVQPGLAETFHTAVSKGVPEPYGKNCQFIYDYLTRPIDQIYYTDSSHLSPEEYKKMIAAVLHKAVQETNEQMLGELPARERTRRNSFAWCAAVVALVVFLGFIVLVFRWMSQGISAPASKDRHRSALAVMFILPALILILVWNYYPLLRGSLMAFQNYNIMGGSPWVGINNFADVIFDNRFWLSLKNAIYFCALWMTMGFLPPVMLAIILQEISLGKMLFRILFYIPAVVSGVVILFMWRAIYDPSPYGILNRLLSSLGIHSQTWLQDPKLAMVCVVFPLAWAHLGPGSIIYLAALKGIPDDIYEASDIDGAGFFSKLRYIVVPYLRPLLVINAVGATIFGFKSGDAVLAMTGGGPNLSTQVIGYEIWQRTFLYLRFGQGTAMAWILGMLLMSFTAYQMRVLARVEFRTAGK